MRVLRLRGWPSHSIWYVTRDFPAAEDRRRALERLENLDDLIVTAGASGEVIEYDAKGKPKPQPLGKANTTELVGLARHKSVLERIIGIIRPKQKALPTDLRARRKELLRRAKEKGLTSA